MIKAVIFDMGGVILDTGGLKKKIMEVLEIEDGKDFWDKWADYETELCKGKMSEEEFWDKIGKEFKKDISYNDVKDFWEDNFNDFVEVRQEVLELISKLKKKYKIGLISNIDEVHARKIRELNILGDFDNVIFSNEVGMVKENKDVFKLSVKNLGVKFGECVFIDDLEEFVGNALDLGIKAIEFENFGKLERDLKETGVEF